MRRERGIKFNNPMYLAVALLLVALFSIFIIGGLYARYYTRADKNANAEVAEFNITLSDTQPDTLLAQNLVIDITPGTNTTKTIEIINKSEVAVEYYLKVTNVTRNMPLKFELVPLPDTTAPEMTKTHENGISINSAVRSPGDYTDKYTLNIVWENTNPQDNLAYIGMVDYITISVKATQAQNSNVGE